MVEKDKAMHMLANQLDSDKQTHASLLQTQQHQVAQFLTSSKEEHAKTMQDLLEAQVAAPSSANESNFPDILCRNICKELMS